MLQVIRKGFTLIELLVVIGIIGTLVAVLLPNYMGTRQRGRDAVRKQDLQNIRKGLELYRQDTTDSSYPASLPAVGSQWANGSSIYMSKFPGDPSGGSYNYSLVGRTYTLCAVLENPADTQGVTCAAPCPIDATKACFSVTNL